MSSNAPATSSWSRGRIGMLLLLLCFAPAGLNTVAPDFWAGLPGVIRWSSYGLSGLIVAVIVWMILTADYSHEASSVPDDSA